MAGHINEMIAPERIVIVGASLAGLRAAEALRREGFMGQLTLIGDEPYPPYDRPPLSKQVLVLQRHLISSSRGSDGHLCSLQDLQDASPPSLFAPALIATGHRLPGSEAFGKLAPRRTRPHDPQDAFHDQTMLDGGTTGGGLLGQERPQLFPALRRQCLQTCQRDGLHNALRWKRMLTGPTYHMTAFGDGLMHASEA